MAGSGVPVVLDAKTVRVQLPSSHKAKQTGSGKREKLKPELDLVKEMARARDEATERLDLSKSQIQLLPVSIKEVPT